ncbi:hypothetical protein ACKKBG_A08955 [Auxenochlorella protothecoides x Auxenochlorella symbiontica]
MSTLAAARADNFYYPPGWDPSKGNLNKFNNSHGALGDRARKLDQGILVIRFEMPFNVWCTGCGHLIGKGVRFNAEKKQVGMYHTTRVWSFSMRAPCCQQRIEVHTDPKNAEYQLVTGARRKVESFNAEAAGTLELESAAERHAVLADPLARLEHAGLDQARASEARAMVGALRRDSTARYKDDYETNKTLRRALRGVRKDEGARESQRRALGLPSSVRLLPGSRADALRAAAVDYGAGGGPGGEAGFQRDWKAARARIKAADAFGGPAPKRKLRAAPGVKLALSKPQ